MVRVDQVFSSPGRAGGLALCSLPTTFLDEAADLGYLEHNASADSNTPQPPRFYVVAKRPVRPSNEPRRILDFQ